MSILRTVCCDVCPTTFTEPVEGDGFAGWGNLQGINFNGAINPWLCHSCLSEVADAMDKMREKNNGVD